MSSPPIGVLSRATFSAPSRAPLSWVKRARRKCRTSFPLLLSKRESATNGSLMLGRVLSGPCSSTGGFAHWTPPWPLLGLHGVVLHSATPRAQLGSCVRPNEHTSSVAGTPPTSTTPCRPQPGRRHDRSGHGFRHPRANQRRAWESVRACDELRSATTGVDHAPTEMVLTRQCADVSKLMYHVRINGDVLDHDLLASFDGQLRASVSNSVR